MRVSVTDLTTYFSTNLNKTNFVVGEYVYEMIGGLLGIECRWLITKIEGEKIYGKFLCYRLANGGLSFFNDPEEDMKVDRTDYYSIPKKKWE